MSSSQTTATAPGTPIATVTVTATTDGGFLQSASFSGSTGSDTFSITLPSQGIPGGSTFTLVILK